MLWKRASPGGCDRQMEMEVLRQTPGRVFNFFSSSFHCAQIYTFVQRRRNNTGAHAQHTTYPERTPTELQVLIYIQLEMSICSDFNLPLIIKPMCVCVPCAQVWIVLFASDLVLRCYLMCQSWNLFCGCVKVWLCVWVTKFVREGSRHC